MRARNRSTTTLTAAAALLFLSGAPAMADSVPEKARDTASTPVLGIVHRNDYFSPFGRYDQAFNGVKVFLSSPRHRDSGRRGECRGPDCEENVNGRRFNMRAANGNHIRTTWQPRSSLRNLHSRGYKVAVSRNSRDDGHPNSIARSRNWGADLHIVTHTNASGGCPSNSSYLLTMYEHADDKRLSRDLGLAP